MKETTEEYDWIVVYDCDDRDRIGTIMRVTEVFDDGSVRGYFEDREWLTVYEFGTLEMGGRQTRVEVGDEVTVITDHSVGWVQQRGWKAKVSRRLEGKRIEVEDPAGKTEDTDEWTLDDIVSLPKVEVEDRVQALKVVGVSKAEGKEGTVTIAGSETIWVKFDEPIVDDECGSTRDTWVVHSWARAAEKEAPADAVERSQAAEIQRLRDELGMAQSRLADHEENFDRFKRQVVTAAKIAARKEGWCADGTNRVLGRMGLSLDDPAEPTRVTFTVVVRMDVTAEFVGDDLSNVDDGYIEGSIPSDGVRYDGYGGHVDMDSDWENVSVDSADVKVEVEDVEVQDAD